MSETNTPDPAHKVGDVANGHRLEQNADGTYAWVPVTAAPRKWYTMKRFIIPAAVLLLIIVIGSLNRPAEPVTDQPVAVSTPDSKPAVKEPVEEGPVKITVPDVTGKTAAEAVAALKAAGFEVPAAENADWIVTATAPAKGGIAEEGSTVTLTVEAPKPKLTLAQQNAIGTAEDYLEYSAFSRSGLIGQLEYEGFSTADATFAVDNITVDWNAQAAQTAKDYLEYSSFSRDSLYDQLVYEGFSDAEAQFGLTAVGY